MAFYHKYPYTDFHELNLDWFLAEFKKVMDATESLDQTVEQFTQFVTNYFDNLDVQQEVNAKLEQMKDDGELTAMLWPLLQDFRSEIEGQMQEQDQQITDATDRMNTLEARMDTFTNLPNASTAGDAELQDIRIGADGYTYSNAGTAVRAQIDNLREDLHDNTVTLITGKYIDPSDGNLYNWSGYNCTNFCFSKITFHCFYLPLLFFECAQSCVNSCDIFFNCLDSHWVFQLIDSVLKTKIEQFCFKFFECCCQLFC